MKASGGNVVRVRLTRAAIVGAAVVGLLVGCSNGDSGDSTSDPAVDTSTSSASPADPTDAEPADDQTDSGGTTAADDPTQDSTDGAEDSGEQNPAGAFVEDPDAYEDEPAPPESEAMVLCNLSSTYLVGLEDVATGEGGSISLAVVALDDSIQVWRPLVGFYPEMTEDLDRTEQVLDLWHNAMDAQDDGDQNSADEFISEARGTIDEIAGPSDELSEELGCGS